jgi:hypothetical protein
MAVITSVHIADIGVARALRVMAGPLAAGAFSAVT